ncbi:Pseudouridine-metabolizing bifunctional protein C1861.05 [Araneus ventricosus]|uniref:Pseudouridine-metabolizing bifunctional protein C1861.05 n=1 Tax=Araneus ventricosus TaxID=182803 RepID=A0A4Y2E9T5_ARAVE|nr:Pseudouridine-metabolizing bifunctional protein C1861.05 [Araneus ventricosus]
MGGGARSALRGLGSPRRGGARPSVQEEGRSDDPRKFSPDLDLSTSRITHCVHRKFLIMHKYLGVARNFYRPFTSLPNFFKISEEVTESLSFNKPVVALESTVITHGLPFPENMKTAAKVEEIVRQNNAIPATIGILNGEVHIGMNSAEMTSLASNKDVLKVSRRDLPYVISQHLSGGTTVAATMALAYRSGISVFATGGIGGVHRGGETTMDVSADLFELSKTPIAVVSAGVKSILDIGRTLEYLGKKIGVVLYQFSKPTAAVSDKSLKAKYWRSDKQLEVQR